MENKIEVLKFSATWCGPCRVLAQTLKDVEVFSFKLEETSNIYTV